MQIFEDIWTFLAWYFSKQKGPNTKISEKLK